MALTACSNCRTGYDTAEERCPMCWAYPEGERGALTRFDDATRRLIAEFGGAYELFVVAPERSWLMWCETGVFRLDTERGVVWRQQTGVLDSVGLRIDRVVLNEFSPDGGWMLDWASGARLRR